SPQAGTAPFWLSPWGAFSWRAVSSPSALGGSGASDSGTPSRRPTGGSTPPRRRRSGCVASRSRTVPPTRWSYCPCRRRRKGQARLSLAPPELLNDSPEKGNLRVARHTATARERVHLPIDGQAASQIVGRIANPSYSTCQLK